MASIFNALNIGYSGLKTSQIAIDTTGHNIANAQNPDYTRQRVVISPQTPLHTTPGDIGLGAKITEIVRIHDEFVYKRLKDASTDHEYNTLRQEVMDEVSTYFPEIEKNGIYDGMQRYFNGWNDFAKNTDDASLKINLAQETRNFTGTVRQTRQQLVDLQNSLDSRLKTAIDEINRLGERIAEINVRINNNESAGDHANDLRDQRDKLELALSKLVDIAVSKGDLRSDTTVDGHLVESADAYHLSIGGSSFVDGPTFHPLVIDRKGENESGFARVYYQRQDYERFDITDYLTGGKVGAILATRDGEIERVNDGLDSFARSMILHTNNLYAANATTRMDGDVAIRADRPIGNSELPISAGNFFVKVYDIDGNEVARREIAFDLTESFDDVAGKINDATVDDNLDGVEGNDVDDFVRADTNGGTFSLRMDPQKAAEGYTFAIEEADADAPTLFAGALGLHRFFDGRDASDIRLAKRLDDNPALIGGNTAPVAGDNSLANAMVELQYDKIDFYGSADSTKVETSETLEGYFRMRTVDVANATASAHDAAETSEALLGAVVKEFDSISKVDIDEELTNLMKYQTGYSASAKVISTIDQMIQTLLSIKQ